MHIRATSSDSVLAAVYVGRHLHAAGVGGRKRAVYFVSAERRCDSMAVLTRHCVWVMDGRPSADMLPRHLLHISTQCRHPSVVLGCTVIFVPAGTISVFAIHNRSLQKMSFLLTCCEGNSKDDQDLELSTFCWSSKRILKLQDACYGAYEALQNT